jgi:hypothetical protein
LGNLLTNGAKYYHWDAQQHGIKWKTGKWSVFPTMKSGLVQSSFIRNYLLRPNTYSISPVAGLFPTDHIVAVLNECSRVLGSEYFIRPNMVVGNDMLIWLRATQKFSEFYFINTPMVSYGNHAGSTTWNDTFNGIGKLIPIYNRLRAYFLATEKKPL